MKHPIKKDRSLGGAIGRSIHKVMDEEFELAKTYAEDGGFYTAAGILAALAKRVKAHAVRTDPARSLDVKTAVKAIMAEPETELAAVRKALARRGVKPRKEA